jgi:hypothetical protein
MKPTLFRYFASRSVNDALDLLDTHGQEEALDPAFTK